MERQTYYDGVSYVALSSKSECVQELGRLEDLREQKRLVELPCVPNNSYIHRNYVSGDAELNIELHNLQEIKREDEEKFLSQYKEIDCCAFWE